MESLFERKDRPTVLFGQVLYAFAERQRHAGSRRLVNDVTAPRSEFATADPRSAKSKKVNGARWDDVLFFFTDVRAQYLHSMRKGTMATTRLKKAFLNLELSGTITVVQKNLMGIFGDPKAESWSPPPFGASG
jgi:hypothetical protein